MSISSILASRRALLCLSVVIATASLPTFAQSTYPNHPIKLISPFPPGGTSDMLARLVAAKLGDGLGQTVTVDNRIGASGNIGHEAAAKSPPDGYTLLLSNSSTTVNNPHLFKKMPFDPIMISRLFLSWRLQVKCWSSIHLFLSILLPMSLPTLKPIQAN